MRQALYTRVSEAQVGTHLESAPALHRRAPASLIDQSELHGGFCFKAKTCLGSISSLLDQSKLHGGSVVKAKAKHYHVPGPGSLVVAASVLQPSIGVSEEETRRKSKSRQEGCFILLLEMLYRFRRGAWQPGYPCVQMRTSRTAVWAGP